MVSMPLVMRLAYEMGKGSTLKRKVLLQHEQPSVALLGNGLLNNMLS